jgi:sterol desaturase/sphingolipid hydroxylase (fatty acid hydroxylase superfamily)
MKKLYVTTRNETVRMFESDWLEFFSHVHPATPIVLYTPLIAYFVYVALAQRRLSILAVAGLFIAGILTWTLLEYVIHRYLFHYQPKTRVGKLMHFIIHGVHHDYPNDATRLVMPPVLSIPLAVVFYILFTLFFRNVAPAISAGFAFGYVCYDSIHYATHHFAMKRGALRWLKEYHLRHHYRDDHAGFGVSSPLWDYIFRTTRKPDDTRLQ